MKVWPSRRPDAWVPVARNARWFYCLEGDGTRAGCRHRKFRAATNCGKGIHIAAELVDGNMIRVWPHCIRAFNGEWAFLPFPNTRKDLEAALAADSWKEAR